MNYLEVSKAQLLDENAELRRRLAQLEDSDRQRRQAEDKLCEREALLLEAQEVAQLGFYVLDIASGCWTASELIYRIFDIATGYERTIESWSKLLHPDDRQEMLAYYYQVIAEKRPFDREYRVVHPLDQEVRWVHGLGRLQFDAAGKPVSMLGTIQDVTAREQAQLDLQQAQDEREQRTAEALQASEGRYRVVAESLAKQHRILKYLLQSSDRERQLIAYEIHDGLAQQLAGALMQLEAFAHLKGTNPEGAAKSYEAGMALLRQGHVEARRLIEGVRPPVLDESGVIEAVEQLVNGLRRGEGAKIRFRSRATFGRLVPVLENAVYRICQEALANACHHSRSDRLRISLVQRNDRLRIHVRDWGIGFDPKSVRPNRFGLEGIRQRARLLGGKCSIQSKPGGGTSIIVEVPVVEQAVEQAVDQTADRTVEQAQG